MFEDVVIRTLGIVTLHKVRTLNITVATVIAGQVKPIRTTVEQPHRQHSLCNPTTCGITYAYYIQTTFAFSQITSGPDPGVCRRVQEDHPRGQQLNSPADHDAMISHEQ